MNLHHELFLMRTGMDRTPILPPMSVATIVHAAAPEHPRESVRRAIRELLAKVPEPGTKAADLTENERMALAVAAGAPYEVAVEAGRAFLRTTVLVGFADRGDGGYIVAIGPKDLPGDTVRVRLGR